MKQFVLLLIAALIITAPAGAQDLNKALNYERFAEMPILHEGRVKPMKSFAALQKKHYAGHEEHALAWLADTLFDPANAIQKPLFEIRNDTLKGQLGVETDRLVFSYEDLQDGLKATHGAVIDLLQKQESSLSDDEKALLNIHDKAIGYAALIQTFSALLPLQTQDGPATFMDLKSAGQNVDPLMSAGQRSTLFKIIPSTWEEGLWLSPWEMILSGQGAPASQALMEDWAALATAYRQNASQEWQQALSKIETTTRAQAGPEYSQTRLYAENLYKTIKPYLWVLGLYAIAVLLYRKPTLALTVTFAAIGIQTAAIGVRIYILDRAPVGTLYESVLFVSLICAAIGALMFAKNRAAPAPLLAGNLSALALLAFAPTLAKGGDSLEVLVAVLNTNFWLATHVLCITIGYGICIIAAMLAHGGLILKAFRPETKSWLPLQRGAYAVSLWALFFTTVGTILGGIWADQSWGRFWGWDPKENGALLIVLWLIWIQHGRLSGHIKPLGFMALTALLNIIVAIAWFGVNLLAVGLHSYGFISGIAEGLLIFCVLETALIGALTLKIKNNMKKS